MLPKSSSLRRSRILAKAGRCLHSSSQVQGLGKGFLPLPESGHSDLPPQGRPGRTQLVALQNPCWAPPCRFASPGSDIGLASPVYPQAPAVQSQGSSSYQHGRYIARPIRQLVGAHREFLPSWLQANLEFIDRDFPVSAGGVKEPSETQPPGAHVAHQ